MTRDLDREQLFSRLRARDWFGRETAYADGIIACARGESRGLAAVSIVLAAYGPTRAGYVRAWDDFLAAGGCTQLVVVKPEGSTGLSAPVAHADVCLEVAANCPRARALNMGALFADAPVIIFLSDRVLPKPRLAKAYADCLRGPTLAVRGRITGAETADRRGFGIYDPGEKPFPWAVDLDDNFAVRAKAFFSLGGLAETLADGGFALEFSSRLLARHPELEAQYYCPLAEAALDLQPKAGDQRDTLPLNNAAAYETFWLKRRNDFPGWV